MAIKKTVIQLWGSQGSGKSNTIQYTYQELIKAYINPTHTYAPIPFQVPNKGPFDINEVINCQGGVKIGLESMGDYLHAWSLQQRLEHLFITEKCDIIICASRVYNNVSTHIAHLAKTQGYRILKFTNFHDDYGHFHHLTLNQHSARHLVNLVDDIIKGII